MPAKKPTASRVNAQNNTELRATQRFVCDESKAVLYRHQIGTYFPIGNEKVKISTDEMQRIKRFDKVGMTLMGFKPRSYLKVYHNVKHSTFVYPDENRVKGSSQCMDSLVREMQRKEKVAIVRAQARDNAQVRFCALLPSLPVEGKEDDPTGFQLIVLPYADDIRELDSIMDAAGYPQDYQPTGEGGICDDLKKDELKAAKALIGKINMKFDAKQFENPTIQKFYTGL